MNPCKRTLLASAIAGIGATIAVDTVHAVNLSIDGRGQVLLYPYYTTRTDGAGNAYGTLLSVINATGSAKAVRVRFLEGKNSREVLDFNLFLSPYDVWTAAVLPDANTGGARIGTNDVSCTLPPFSMSPTAPFVGFVNFAYSGANDDGAGTSLDRTKEGYFEIIEMATYTSSSITGKAVTHVATATSSVPPCNSPVLLNTQAALDAQPPSGGLFGGLTLINVGSGTDYTADAVALARFFQGDANYHTAIESLPDLTQATPPVSGVLGPDGRFYESTWQPGTADPVSAVLMHDSVMNEFVLDSATKSGTDWVVTMPTKRYCTRVGTGVAPKLFQRNFTGTSGACDDLAEASTCFSTIHGIYDREERTLATFTGCFSAPPPRFPQQLCWAANVATFSNSNVFGSTNVHNIAAPFQNGWLNMSFPTEIPDAAPTVHKLINRVATTISGGDQLTIGNTLTYVGLPIIGFAVHSYMNGTLQVGGQTVLSNYGGNFVHKTSTTIQ